MVESTSIVQQAKAILVDCGHQEELLAEFEKRDQEGQEKLAQQVVHLNSVTPVGMKNYCERARKLLSDSKNNVNAFD